MIAVLYLPLLLSNKAIYILHHARRAINIINGLFIILIALGKIDPFVNNNNKIYDWKRLSHNPRTHYIKKAIKKG